MKTLPSPAEMDRAFRAADASYDGVFFVGVRSTGIFCRPSCPARRPRPENVQFLDSPAEALRCGYRPCKRCQPLDTDGRLPALVRRLLEAGQESSGARISDAGVRAMGIDPARARRWFRRHYGMTFQAYQRARQLGMALPRLRRGQDQLEVAFDSGFESSSGFREAFQRVFGAPPGRGKEAACAVMDRLRSPLGPLIAAAVPSGLCFLEFHDRRGLPGQMADLRKRLGCAIVPGRNEHLERLEGELGAYFAGRRKEFGVPLVIAGTPFQETVWRRLLAIPYGSTLSYEELAREIGRAGAQRAVGQANGANRLAILVPCHRVVQKDGRLRGYGGGLWRKQFLLDLESSAPGPDPAP